MARAVKLRSAAAEEDFPSCAVYKKGEYLYLRPSPGDRGSVTKEQSPGVSKVVDVGPGVKVSVVTALLMNCGNTLR